MLHPDTSPLPAPHHHGRSELDEAQLDHTESEGKQRAPKYASTATIEPMLCIETTRCKPDRYRQQVLKSLLCLSICVFGANRYLMHWRPNWSRVTAAQASHSISAVHFLNHLRIFLQCSLRAPQTTASQLCRVAGPASACHHSWTRCNESEHGWTGYTYRSNISRICDDASASCLSTSEATVSQASHPSSTAAWDQVQQEDRSLPRPLLRCSSVRTFPSCRLH